MQDTACQGISTQSGLAPASNQSINDKNKSVCAVDPAKLIKLALDTALLVFYPEQRLTCCFKQKRYRLLTSASHLVMRHKGASRVLDPRRIVPAKGQDLFSKRLPAQ